MSTSLLHYLRAPDDALREMKRVLKPGGQVIVSDWCDDYLACRLCDRFLRLFNRAHFKTYGFTECVDLDQCIDGSNDVGSQASITGKDNSRRFVWRGEVAVRRAILAILLLCALAVPAIAEERGLGMHLTGRDAVELSNVERLHYVVGLMDAWLLEAFITDGERFGWLMGCMNRRLGGDAAQLEAIFRSYLNNHPNDMNRAGSAIFFSVVLNVCNPHADQRAMVR